jgi:hypothetical protein
VDLVAAPDPVAGAALEAAGAAAAAVVATAAALVAAAPAVTVTLTVWTAGQSVAAAATTGAATVTVTNLVEVVHGEDEAATAAALVAATAAAEELTAATGAATAPPAGAAPTTPARFLVVKLENPWATMISATLRPALANGVLMLLADRAFSVAAPTTSGSMSGTIPLRATVVGRVGSLQMVGILTLNGLKFCSAATRPLAAARASAPVPSWAII